LADVRKIKLVHADFPPGLLDRPIAKMPYHSIERAGTRQLYTVDSR